MDLFSTKLRPKEVAQATGVTSKQISDWCNQGRIVGQAEAARGWREFSFFNVMEVASAVAMMEAGITSPSDAFRAAMHFSHFGSSHGGWVNDKDEVVENPPTPKRHPGLPYHYRDGETFMAVSGQLSNVVRSEKGQIDTYKLFPMNPRPTGFVLLNMTEVFKGVIGRAETEKSWTRYLDEAYDR